MGFQLLEVEETVLEPHTPRLVRAPARRRRVPFLAMELVMWLLKPAAGSGGGWGGNGGMPGMPPGVPGYNGGGMSGMPGVPGSVNGMPSNNRGNTLGPYYYGGGISGNGSPYTPGYPGGYPGSMSGPYYNGGNGSPQYQPRYGGSPQYQPLYGGGSPPSYPGIHRKSSYSGSRGSGGASARISQGETCFAPDVMI